LPFDIPTAKKREAVDDGLYRALLARFSERDLACFSQRQLQSLETACQNVAWGHHPVRLKLSLPVLFSRFYLVLLMGKERRSASRQAASHPHRRVEKLIGTAVVAILVGSGLYGLYLLQSLLFTATYAQGAG